MNLDYFVRRNDSPALALCLGAFQVLTDSSIASQAGQNHFHVMFEETEVTIPDNFTLPL